jgi:hypothetical protein
LFRRVSFGLNLTKITGGLCEDVPTLWVVTNVTIVAMVAIVAIDCLVALVTNVPVVTMVT